MIFKEIDVHKLNELFNLKKDIILVDVRTDQEVLLSKIDIRYISLFYAPKGRVGLR